MMYDETTTIADVLKAWDAGDSIWSVEMGGMGPGYEQCIQVLAVEIMREKDGTPLPEKDGWDHWGDEVVHRLDKTFGFSGAQVGAAKNIASVYLKQGYAKGLGMVDADRRIQVRKNFPQMPTEIVT
jgi:hypothetical protein